jgi:hypothetical protein
VFSLYLDLRQKNPAARLETLLREAAEQKKLDLQPGVYQENWREDANQMRLWFASDEPLTGQGLAVFAHAPAGLLRAFHLPVAVQDRLLASDKPFLRPLEILRAEFQCTLVVLIDEQSARLVLFQLGKPQEVDDFPAVSLESGAAGDGLEPFAQAVAGRIEAARARYNCPGLLLSGSGEPLNTLHAALRDSVVATLDLAPDAHIQDILLRVQAFKREQERLLETWLVQELVAHAEDQNSGQAVLGLEQSLLAVRSAKVRVLVVEEDFHQAGGECPNCGFLSDGDEEVCLLCGVALRPEPDVVELAMKKVLEHGGSLEILRSEQTRRSLEPYGRIGALLHDTGSLPPEKDLANRRYLTHGGQTDPQALPGY